MIIQLLKNKFFQLLEKLDRKRIILDRVSKEPYLERYYIFLKYRKHFPFNIFLHKFLKGDPDDVHDHPWPFATLIIKGGYWEYKPVFNSLGEQIGGKRFWCKPGSLRFSSACSYHRIELEPAVECWTIFIPGPQLKEWGFLVGNKWVPNEQYLQSRKFNNILT
jgi:hypothetical protein